MDSIQITDYARGQIIEEFKMQIALEQSVVPETEWEYEYQRGLIDGLQRAIDLLLNE